MQSVGKLFNDAYISTVEVGLKQEDYNAKRAAAANQANTAAQMRLIVARHQANQPAPPIQTPNTDLSSVGDPNTLPLDGGQMPQPGGMMGEMAAAGGVPPGGGPMDLMPGGPGGGRKPATPFGESARPGMSDTAAELRELGRTLIIGGDYKTGRQFIKDAGDAEKRGAEIDIKQLESQRDMADMLASVARGVHDQSSMSRALLIGQMHGIDVSSILDQFGGRYSPEAQAFFDQYAESSMSIREQSQQQIATARLANDNKRTESIVQARSVSIAKNKQSMGIARERLDLAKGSKVKNGDEPKHGKSFEFDRTMEAAGIKPGSADYVKAARIKARLEKGAGGSSLTDEISKMLGEGSAGEGVLAPPGPEEAPPKPKAEKPAKEQTYGKSESDIAADMEYYGKSREEIIAAYKARASK